MEAAALSYKNNYIDIYSNSWGAEDDGAILEQPGELTAQALVKGTKDGRNGKGSIYVWAAGNGGDKQDNCNCDGYVNSIYTIGVSAAGEEGESSYYAEKCSAALTTAFSGSDNFYKKIVTTDLSTGGCSEDFSGTSAATPMVAAIIALALEADPDLTWRDVQHISE
jgi:subtilisin family serine protease